MRLNDDDVVVDMIVTDPISDESELKDYRLLTVSRKGYGKITPLSEYRLTNRGVMGVRTMRITEPDDGVVALKIVDDQDIIIISEDGNSIRISSENVREIGRNTKGVILIKLKENDYVSSIEICEPEDEDEPKKPENKQKSASKDKNGKSSDSDSEDLELEEEDLEFDEEDLESDEEDLESDEDEK